MSAENNPLSTWVLNRINIAINISKGSCVWFVSITYPEQHCVCKQMTGNNVWNKITSYSFRRIFTAMFDNEDKTYLITITLR